MCLQTQIASYTRREEVERLNAQLAQLAAAAAGAERGGTNFSKYLLQKRTEEVNVGSGGGGGKARGWIRTPISCI